MAGMDEVHEFLANIPKSRRIWANEELCYMVEPKPFFNTFFNSKRRDIIYYILGTSGSRQFLYFILDFN